MDELRILTFCLFGFLLLLTFSGCAVITRVEREKREADERKLRAIREEREQMKLARELREQMQRDAWRAMGTALDGEMILDADDPMAVCEDPLDIFIDTFTED